MKLSLFDFALLAGLVYLVLRGREPGPTVGDLSPGQLIGDDNERWLRDTCARIRRGEPGLVYVPELIQRCQEIGA